MIKKLTLKNFKSFHESTIELGPLSIILGANATGKSNFVDALRVMQGKVRGLTLTEIFSGKWEGGQQVWTAIRGGEDEAFNLLEQDRLFQMSLEWELQNSNTPQQGAYQIEIVQDNEKFFVAQEKFALTGFQYVALGLTAQLPLDTDEPPEIKKWGYVFKQWLSDIYFPSFAPSAVREYVSSKRTELGQRGENLSAIIFRMASDPNQRQTLLEWLRELCPQEIVDFDFIQTQLGDVLLAVKEPNGVTISARSMSDGTLRFLATVVALLHAKEGSLFVLEDIDSDLHPTRLHLLVSFLEQVTVSRKIQVIATSHSPYLLDHLSEQSLASVLVFARDHESQCTKVSKLVDIPGFAEARQHNPLDLLHASGWMEQNL
jgi:predicted ATPase